MKPIEIVVRSQEWDRATQAFFHGHLKKPMSDDARLGYCRRKASFLGRGNAVKKRAGLKLVTWALETFTKAKEERGYARATRAELLEDLGEYRESAAAERSARAAAPSFAASVVHEARALLRANDLVAAPEVLALERRVTRDRMARSITAYAVWRHAILAFCAEARGEADRARRNAKKALGLAAGETDFEAWMKKHRRIAIPALDLKRREVEALHQLVG